MDNVLLARLPLNITLILRPVKLPTVLRPTSMDVFLARLLSLLAHKIAVSYQTVFVLTLEDVLIADPFSIPEKVAVSRTVSIV
jgi:hypothetical protein